MSSRKIISVIILTITLFYGGCTSSNSAATIETFGAVQSWTSPYWGYNAPKIIRNEKGEIWTVIFMGKYGEQKAQIMKRDVSGIWHKGKIFDQLYQPGMLFLDNEGRINYIQNSQYDPIEHYRSSDAENLNNFSLVSRGNGVQDGRGWYVGVGIHESVIYLSYVTLQYDLFLTWKNVTDSSWHEAILIEPGLIDTASGNHSWLYPRFNFKGDKGYITVSGTVDGSKYNTYDKVHLATFSLGNPAEFTKEIVFNGTVGYYSFSYDAIITSTNKFICGYNAGKYRYGDNRENVTPEGIYVSIKDIAGSAWTMSQVDDHTGGIALHEGNDGTLYALITRGSWDSDSKIVLKKSSDAGSTWETIDTNVVRNIPHAQHPFFAQIVHSHSGSMPGAGINGVFSNHANVNVKDGLYDFELLYVHIDLSKYK